VSEQTGADPGENPGWWDELAVVALLGTDRRPPFDRVSMPGGLGTAVARLSGDPATVLLDAAALAVAYRRGGVVPERVPAEPDRAPAERQLRASARAGALLAEALTSKVALVGYWCETAAGAGLVAPDAQLPALLDRAVSTAAVRPAIAGVLGERGYWLAQLQPCWAAAVGLEAPQPGGLAEDWASRSGPERVRFLALLADRLSLADEPFLEAALDDARPAVRAALTGLLATLPGSAYAGRMQQRAAALIQIGPAAGSAHRTATVRLPDRLDPQAVRDGITDLPPAHPAAAPTRHQWWLEQIVAATPLTYWETVFGSAAAAIGTGFDELAQPAVRAGWVRATVRQRNPEWAGAVLATGTRLGADELLALLPAEQQVAVLRARLPTVSGRSRAAHRLPGRLPGPLAGGAGR
jgi:hypothetical protein